jgi:hypothetical protein
MNALNDGWSVKKNQDKYIFKKKHENKIEIFQEDYLATFIMSNMGLNNIYLVYDIPFFSVIFLTFLYNDNTVYLIEFYLLEIILLLIYLYFLASFFYFLEVIISLSHRVRRVSHVCFLYYHLVYLFQKIIFWISYLLKHTIYGYNYHKYYLK